MALETVIYNQETFAYGCKEYYNNNLGNFNYNYELDLLQGEAAGEMSFTSLLDSSNNNNREESSSSPVLMYNNNAREYNIWDPNSSLEDHQLFMEGSPPAELPAAAIRSAATSGRRKRRRTRSCKNKEELENQRMTHIAVERNRRKQMNEYLAVIRSLMPPSYVQRGDQASIIGGAINFVKELEHHLQTLEAQKRIHSQKQEQHSDHHHGSSSNPLFAEYFSFPQYSTHSKSTSPAAATAAGSCDSPPATEKMSALADIEVSMAESHANLKILSKRRPKQLLKIVAGLQCLWLTVLHLNVTTVDHMVLYSLSLKLEEGCQLSTADEIADSVNQLLARIQEEAASSS